MKVPNHLAIILDGNRRWARSRGLKTLEGHKKGFENLINLVKHCKKKGIKILSVFAFSTENFKRSKEEVDYLMDLFVNGFKTKKRELLDNNIKVIFSGRKINLNKEVVKVIDSLTELTKNNTGPIFNVCLNYGSHQEIIDAFKKMKDDNINFDTIDEDIVNKYLYQDLPPIDYLIRTSGEVRISNFMLWQLSYAELYFTDIMFPDFNELELDKTLTEFELRNRRFGE